MATRIDWIVFRRILARVSVTILIFLALLTLVESLDGARFARASAIGGLPLALAAMIAPALRSCIGTLPITVLIGTMAAILDLQQRQELTVMKTAGLSLWQIMRLPVFVVLILASGISVFGETLSIMTNRSVAKGSVVLNEPLWLEQGTGDDRYILHALRSQSEPPHVEEVTAFEIASSTRARIVAASATLLNGRWKFENGARYSPDGIPEPFETTELPTTMTHADFALQFSKAKDLTIGELFAAAMADISDPQMRAITLTSLYRTFALPVMVVGSMLIGFALTARHRRRGDYGQLVVQGLVVGFVLFTLNELAIRAGDAQVIPPLAATAGPALVSILTGLTALLFLEDGYT